MIEANSLNKPKINKLTKFTPNINITRQQPFPATWVVLHNYGITDLTFCASDPE